MHVAGYRAEDHVWRRRRVELSIREQRALAARLCDHFDVPLVDVVRGRHGSAGSYYNPGARHERGTGPARITLGRSADGSSDWIVCHEIAHHVTYVRGTDRGHGSAWAAVYVAAVAHAISAGWARRLAAAMRREGVRLPERRLAEMGETEMAAVVRHGARC